MRAVDRLADGMNGGNGGVTFRTHNTYIHTHIHGMAWHDTTAYIPLLTDSFFVGLPARLADRQTERKEMRGMPDACHGFVWCGVVAWGCGRGWDAVLYLYRQVDWVG